MSGADNTFTGQRRERKTRRIVLLSNGLAKYTITLGGLFTIVSVLLVMFFLLYVALPLFLPSSIVKEEELSYTDAPEGAALIYTDTNEYMTIAFSIYSDGSVHSYDLATGKLIDSTRLFEDRTITAWGVSPVNSTIILGFQDGTVASGDIEFDTEFLDIKDIPAEAGDINETGRLAFDGGVVELLDGEQYRYQKLELNFGETIQVTDNQPILLLDITQSSLGEIFTTYSADGIVRVSKLNRTTNMLTGEETISVTGGQFQLNSPVPGIRPKWLKISGLGDFVYAIWESGPLIRLNTRDINNIYSAEALNIAADNAGDITCVNFTLGRSTLLIGFESGLVSGWFNITENENETIDGFTLIKAHELQGVKSPVKAITSSRRSRKTAVGYENGGVRLFFVTSDEMIAEYKPEQAGTQVRGLVISPKEDYLLALTNNEKILWKIEAEYTETSLKSMFLPVWYEGYARPEHVWQTSSAADDFEPKYGMIPLIFGTLKATVYSLLFGVPIALLGAIYTSQFLHPKRRIYIKTIIELMASLPSVVLGFLAGLVLAPIIEDIVPAVLVSLYLVPFALMAGAYLWQLIPSDLAVRMSRFRLGAIMVALPAGILLSGAVGPVLEKLFFDGDIKTWLNSSEGGGFGGTLLMVIPLSILAVAMIFTVYVAPWLRSLATKLRPRYFAWIDFAKFLAGTLLVIIIALLLAWIATVLGFDPRGGLMDTYVQRNAMIVGFIMGFAIIPIIYTIAEDALSSVPEHLKAGSLGAGATPWQTAVRIIIPTAMSGLFSSIMIGLGRAVGETMIVLMAAGNTPILEWNIFNGFRTLSANIAVELPEAVQNSTHYRSLFLSALVLFIMTFIINTLAELVRQRFRRRSSQL